MKICILGLGYIGLPTALLLATHGHKVVGIDVNKKIVDILNDGKTPFDEEGLDDLMINAKGNFVAATEVVDADAFLIAVPTPLDKHIKISDLTYVRLATDMICPHLKRDNIVILESTVPPGTSERLLIPMFLKNGLKIDEFNFAHCPERAIPGQTLYEMINNDRIIGGYNEKSSEIAKSIYSSFIKGNIYLTDTRTAEFVKLMENTYRDVNIAIANELAHIAEECGVNIWSAIELANKHPRVNVLKPGPGVGGHCIAIDPWFLTETSTKFKLISLAREINDNMPNYVLQIIRTMLKGIDEPTITIFGVAYKGNVDDTRETPAIKLIKLAINEGYSIRCYDPHAKNFEYELFDLDNATCDSDCIVLITDHEVFKNIDPSKLKMRNKNLVDTRNILNHEKWIDTGFQVKILGNGKYYGK